MPTLNNSASIKSYTFQVSPTATSNATSNIATTNIEVTAATVEFTKTNTPEYIKPGSTATISYTIKNLNPEAIRSIIIQDAIFTTLDVTATTTPEHTLSGDTLTLTIPNTGELQQNESITATVTLLVNEKASPDSFLYDTVATGSFIVKTQPETTVEKTSRGHLEVNAAIVSLNKSLTPNVATITSGNLLTYTLVFTNSGNVRATIPIGHFVDTWQEGMLTNISCLNPKFTISGNQISNNVDLTIEGNTTVTLIYTGIASAPTIV